MTMFDANTVIKCHLGAGSGGYAGSGAYESMIA